MATPNLLGKALFIVQSVLSCNQYNLDLKINHGQIAAAQNTIAMESFQSTSSLVFCVAPTARGECSVGKLFALRIGHLLVPGRVHTS